MTSAKRMAWVLTFCALSATITAVGLGTTNHFAHLVGPVEQPFLEGVAVAGVIGTGFGTLMAAVAGFGSAVMILHGGDEDDKGGSS